MNYNDAVLSFDLAANTTFADLALALRRLVGRDARNPIGIAVTFATSQILAPNSTLLH